MTKYLWIKTILYLILAYLFYKFSIPYIRYSTIAALVILIILERVYLKHKFGLKTFPKKEEMRKNVELLGEIGYWDFFVNFGLIASIVSVVLGIYQLIIYNKNIGYFPLVAGLIGLIILYKFKKQIKIKKLTINDFKMKWRGGLRILLIVILLFILALLKSYELK